MSERPTTLAPVSADAPATVHDYTSDGWGLRAAVTHPAGTLHENARLTIKRLMARGYAIVPLKTPPCLVVAEAP